MLGWLNLIPVPESFQGTWVTKYEIVNSVLSSLNATKIEENPCADSLVLVRVEAYI